MIVRILLLLMTMLPFTIEAQTVVDIVVNSDNHNTLETAVIEAQLVDDLSGDGPFTVFAPTDAAFDLLPEGQLEALLQDPTGALADILTYHVVGGVAAGSGDLSNGQSINTLLGKDVNVSINTNGVYINGMVVSVTDIEASNGIVHVLDAVLLPPATNVVDIVVNSPDHNTLETAVIEAGLVDALSGEGPFTVFAPTDAAFDLLPEGTLQELLNDPSGDLTDILLYHVVNTKAFAADLSDAQEITTLLENDVKVTINDEGVFINDSKVSVTDILAENGVVHVIDAVLLPPAANTIVDIVVNSDNHNTLETAVLAAELADDLSGEGPFTLFAPTDAAFDLLPEGQLEALLQDPTGLLADILTYHTVAGVAAKSTDLSNGQEITTLFGKDVTASVNANGVFINGIAVSVANIEADNGVVHVIDAVLLPPAATVVDIVVASPDHNTLETAVIEAGLVDALSGDGPFTVFAPTDAAFDLLPDGKLQELLDDPSGELTEILQYHVVSEKAFSSDLSNEQVFSTLLEKDIEVTINEEGVFINDSKVVITDIVAENGVVHVIDQVLLPTANTIVDIVVNSDAHNTLESLVIQAELVETLQGEGPFTLFAPTDEAFALVPQAIIDELVADPTGKLKDVLLYHAVAGSALSTDLSDGQVIETVLGQDVTVTINADGVFINNAQVTIADIEADNGVVHVINAVLVPQAVLNTSDSSFETLSVSPNPTNNMLNVDLGKHGNEATQMTVYNAVGQAVQQFSFAQGNVTIDVSGLSSGSYYLQMVQAEHQGVISFVKE